MELKEQCAAGTRESSRGEQTQLVAAVEPVPVPVPAPAHLTTAELAQLQATAAAERNHTYAKGSKANSRSG